MTDTPVPARAAPPRSLKDRFLHPRRGWFRRALSWGSTVAVLALLALGVFVAVIPALHRGTALNVLTGSMQPTLKPGDLAIVYAVDSFDDIAIGDIVTFMPYPDDPTLVTHRAIGWSTQADGTRLLITQGDANNAADDPIMEKQVRAKMAYKIPWIGHLLQYSDFAKPIAVVVVAIILLAYSAYALITSVKRK
ncbi:MAG: signal peptidase I [Propionibacteriaceae bacterium]|jgi:signal peptidase|nr:signal peptidase I [Propionibacteriaceae bacterium]